MDLTRREACLLVLPAIINDGLHQACKPLVDFLLASVTKAANYLACPRTVQPRIGIRDFYPSPAVVNHRPEHVIYRQLRVLCPTAATAGDHPSWR
jgi:hypothetical protein